MVVFKRAVSSVLWATAVAFVLSAAWASSAFGEGPATYEISFGSAGPGYGHFAHPAGIAVGTEGEVWVVDQGNDRVQKFDEAGEYLSEFGSGGSENGQFSTPKAIAIDAEGNLWVADSGNDRLEQFNKKGEFIKAVGSGGSGNGHFSGPEDIAIDAEGDIWVSDTYNYRIQKLDEEGEFIEVVNPEGLGAIEPTGIGVGSGGDVYVADWTHNRVVELSEAGAFVRQFGSGGSGNGKFSHPDAIAVDAKGNVWVGDEGNDRVEQFNESGEYLGQFGSGGSGEGEFGFAYPFGIATDSNSHIWVTDPNNNRVQRWTTAAVPLCHSGEASTEVNEPLVLEAGALECEGEEPLEYEIVSGPKHGEITGFNAATGALTYTPNSEFLGADSFKFAASNALGKSGTKSFSIHVGELPLGEGIVAAYAFNEDEGETAHDAANGYDGVIDGSNWVQGKYGSALNFANENGESEGADFVQVPETPALDLTESLTVEAWVRPRVLNSYAPVVTKARGVYDQSYELAAGGQDWGVPASFIVHKNHTPVWASSSEELPPEVWSHLAMTYDGELMRLYVDGALVDTQPSEPPHPDDSFWNDAWLNIGIGSNSGSAFDGKIDEVRIYDRALGGVEIEKDMTTPIEGSEGSEDPEEPEAPGECELPQLHVSGSAADEEAPGAVLNVWASPGSPQCAEDGELSRLAEVSVSIDEELVFSESRNCERPNDPCGPGFSRTIQLPYEKLIGSHLIEVSGKDQQGNSLEAIAYPEETPEEGTVARAPTEAEASTSEGDCKTPRNRHDRSPKNPHGYRIEKGVLYGTPCADIIGTHKNVRVYYGMEKNDIIRGGAKTNEVFRGGEGVDTVFGGRGTDRIRGGDGADRLNAGSGDDRLRGEDGNDTLIGGPGEDLVRGEDGADLVRGGTTIDTLSGGEGEDTLSYADGITPGFEANPEAGNENAQTAVVPNFPERGEERGVYVNLSGAPAVIGNDSGVARFGGGSDKFVKGSSFQDVIGTPFADLIIGSSDPNRIDAGAGTDIVRGGPDNDQIYGGADSDYLEGEGGSDGLHGGKGPGFDTCVGGGDESCEGESAEAGVEPPSAATISVGVQEPDSGSEGADVYLRGSEHPDSVTATWSSGDVHFVASGEGTGRFNTEDDGISGCEVSAANATCPISGSNAIVISGGPGHDVLKALEFPTEIVVTLLGGEDPDVLRGGNHSADVLVDGPGSAEDELFGNGEDDAMFENDGADLLNGGAGNDLFVSSTVCDGDTIRGGSGSDNANWAQLVEGEVEGSLRWDQAPYNHPEHGIEAQIANGEGKGSLDREGGSCANEGGIFAVENLEGSHGPDVLTGNNDENVLLGRNGKDVLRGLGDDDLLLANNRDPKGKSEQEQEDPDQELNCGGGHDILKRDPDDAGHFSNCERHHSAKGAESSVPGVGSDPGESPEVQDDEGAIGSAADPETPSPDALYRLEETSGEVASDWTDEESETAGAYEGGVELDQPGALAESQGVNLDGVNDYLDLTSNWDPVSARANTEPCETAGYSVEMWVKFDSSAEGREELFSRSAGASGVEIYRSADDRLNFGVSSSVESPTTHTDEPVSDSEWHHVVATLEEPVECEEGEASLMAAPSFFGAGEEGGFEPPLITLYVDGFAYPLGTQFAFPASTSSADNLVGARATSGGPTDFLAAEVDDVAIYEEALSEIDVATHLASSEAEPVSTILASPIDPTDTDEDEVPDSVDNCSETSNPGQEDADLDGVGDACQPEPDEDEDEVADEVDNCPEIPNSEQIDSDENGVGDACEPE